MKTKKENILKAFNMADCQETKDTLKRLYPEIEFERKLPETWEEFCDIIGIKEKDFNFRSYTNGDYRNIDYEIFWGSGLEIPNKYAALRKLELLRDYYNNGWEPDYDIITEKHVIFIGHKNGKHLKFDYTHSFQYFLVFKSGKLRDKFAKHFENLIFEAEDLI